MQVTVEIGNRIFVGESDSLITAAQKSQEMLDNVLRMGTGPLRMKLESGQYVVLPQEMVEKAIFTISN